MLTYIKVLPANYSPSEFLPLVAFFPGHKGTALKFKKLFAGEQAKRRFIGVYFNTPEGGWNMKDHWHEIEETLIDAADNTSGWYAVGISNGACLALQMQCEAVFIGVASFAGSLFEGDTANPPFSETRKTVMFNGKKDKSTPFYGGNAHGVNMIGAEASIMELGCHPMFSRVETYGYSVNSSDKKSFLYAFDNYGHDVYAKVSSELKWNLPEMVLNFFGISKNIVK